MSAVTTKTITLRNVASASLRALKCYTGTMFAVFAVQSLLAAACLFAVAQVMASVFAYRPMFDDGIAGDLTSLLWSWQYGKSAVIASAWLVMAVVLIWIIASWFLTGGVAGVLLHQPQGRADTAKQFGASGVNTFFGFAMLSLIASMVGLGILLVFATCASWAGNALQNALTTSQLVLALVVAFGPAMLLTMVLWTIIDHARLELCLRRDSHDLGASLAFFRAARFVLTHPRTLLWSLVNWSIWGAIGIAYSYLMHNAHPSSAWSLLIVRLGISLLRMCIKFAGFAGHAQWAMHRVAPVTQTVG